jgi:hypothetical protein
MSQNTTCLTGIEYIIEPMFFFHHQNQSVMLGRALHLKQKYLV